MDITILPIKLQIPLPTSKILHRPRLAARLDDALRLPLTLIAADAGFGKTTCVATGLAAGTRRLVWYRLDAGDSDPAVFAAHLLRGLKPHLRRSAYTSASCGLTQITDWNAAAQILSLALHRLRDDVSIVLDDFHLLAAPTLNEGMTRLIEVLPPRAHLAILTRVVPALPLPRWRARGRLSEIRPDDLRFTVDELRALLVDLHGLRLSDTSLHVIAARTEGWPAGVVLALHATLAQGPAGAAQSLSSLSGSTRDIYDYLAQEAFARQTAACQRFMLATAEVSRFNADLAAALLGTSSGENREIIAHLERSHLFVVPLDRERRWYRYHHLFEEFLRRTAADHDVTSVHGIHHRAAQWWEARGEMNEALRHLVASEEFHRAAVLLGAHGLEMVARGQLETVRRWLSMIPVDTWAAAPRLYLVRGLAETMSGNAAEGVRAFEEARRQLRSLTDVEGEISAFRWLVNAAIWSGGMGRLVPVLPEIAEIETRARAFPPAARSHVLAAIGRIVYWRGDSVAAESRFREATAAARSSSDDYAYLWCGRPHAELLANTGRLHDAIALFEELLGLTHRRGWLHDSAHLHAELATALLLVGQDDSAERHVAEGRLLQETIPCRVLQTELRLASARVAARLGAWERAETFLRELLGPGEHGTSYGLWRFDATVELSLLVSRTNRAEAQRLAMRAVAAKEDFGVFRSAQALLAAGIVSRSADRCREAAETFAAIQASHCQALALVHAAALTPSDARSHVAKDAAQALRSLTAEAWEFITAHAPRALLAPFGGDPVMGPRISVVSPPSQPPRLAIRCFGRFEMVRGDRVFGRDAWQRVAPKRLLQYLLLQHRPVHREEIIDALWPDFEPRHGANQLRVAMSHLRHVLEPERRAREPSSLVLTTGSTVEVARDRFDLDVDRFARGLAAATASDGTARRDALVEIVGLYRGPLFADDPFEEWVHAHRDRLERQYLDALTALAEIEEQEGHQQSALRHWQAAIEIDPAAEHAYRGLLRCYLTLGRASDALRVFESCRQALADIDAVVSADTLALRRSIPGPTQETRR